ncbi:hypothetical protein [Plantibacter sp. YIM 135347]|uniref:hypothetical protein n=1 Tax=Plantibacter sp. YIM 135347 TaxID=3423919 RepID=UPI003D34D0B2
MTGIRVGTAAYEAVVRRGTAVAAQIRTIALDERIPLHDAQLAWLEARWRAMEDEEPLRRLPWRLVRPVHASEPWELDRLDVVDPRLIVSIGDACTWGRLRDRTDSRPHTFTDVLDGVDEAARSGGWSRWLANLATSPVEVQETRGPYGPVYQVRSDGRHRAMLARAMGLPHLEVLVSTQRLPAPGTSVLVSLGGGFVAADLEYYDCLVDVGEASSSDVGDSGLWEIAPACSRETSWHFDPPASVVQAAVAYRDCHPRFGESPEHAMMFDEEQWRSRVAPLVPTTRIDRVRARLEGRRHG